MADDEGTVEASTNGGGSPGKRKPQKKHYPFGTPSHKVPYSQYNHLKSTDILLFQEISQSDTGIKAEIRSGDEDLTRGGKDRVKRLPVKVDDDFLKYAQPTKPEEGQELCKRIDCRNLLRKILESVSTLQMERDNIGVEIELSGNEYAASEQEALQLDEKLKIINRENDQLEATLEHLNAQVAKLETKKLELQQERDEFGNKMMVTETEKQNWIRLVQQSHKGLADAMWRGERQTIESTHTDIILHKRDPNFDYSKLDRTVSTSYKRLASAGVLDYCERPLPPSSSSIPLYLRNELLQSNSVELDAYSTAGSAGSNNQYSPKPGSAGRLKPLVIDDDTRLRQKIEKLQKDNSPFVKQTHPNAYRGYTPTGAPVNRASSNHRISQTAFQESNSMSLLTVKKQLSKSMPSLNRRSLSRLNASLNSPGDMLSYSSEMPNSECKLLFRSKVIVAEKYLLCTVSNNPEHTWQKLDPVFYHSRAGESFSRTERIGKQKMVKNQAEFTRLLTYQHPGLFNNKAPGEL
jgi:hypothetical protein